MRQRNAAAQRVNRGIVEKVVSAICGETVAVELKVHIG
jgi:hypothetical protein